MRKRLTAAVAASISFSLCSIAIIYLVAALANGSARTWMSTWEEGGRVVDRTEWEIVRERLELAHRLTPLNADYAADVGRLLDWVAWQYPPDDARGARVRRAATAQYEEALRRRPSWGYGWAHLAQSRLLAQGPDGEFRYALRKAVELAPWEPQVLRKVAWLGMATWNELGPELRDVVRLNVLRAVTLDVHRHEVIRLAFQYEWLDELRPMLRDESQRAAYERVASELNRR